jgi:chemotaxis signal transduction protein
VFDQNESVQVFSLEHILTGKRQPLGEHSSILIVAVGTQRIGFAVKSLKTIETSSWEKKIPVLGKSRHDIGNFGQAALKHVQIGHAPNERMLRLLDLNQLGQRLVGCVAHGTELAIAQSGLLQ